MSTAIDSVSSSAQAMPELQVGFPATAMLNERLVRVLNSRAATLETNTIPRVRRHTERDKDSVFYSSLLIVVVILVYKVGKMIFATASGQPIEGNCLKLLNGSNTRVLMCGDGLGLAIIIGIIFGEILERQCLHRIGTIREHLRRLKDQISLLSSKPGEPVDGKSFGQFLQRFSLTPDLFKLNSVGLLNYEQFLQTMSELDDAHKLHFLTSRLTTEV